MLAALPGSYEGPMNQAEVIRPEVQCNNDFQVGQLAREGQEEPMKTGNLHSHLHIQSIQKVSTNICFS